MTDKLNLTTPYLDAVLHALIDPERTDFEIRHLDLGRARSGWLAELRREIADVRALSAPSLTRHIAAELYATDGTGRVTIPGPLYVVTDTDVDELLAARQREIAGLSAREGDAPKPTWRSFDTELLNALKVLADNSCTDPSDPDWACDQIDDFPKSKWCAVCVATHIVNEIYRLQLAACADQPWQPIESAPKDREVLLGALSDAGSHRWLVDVGRHKTSGGVGEPLKHSWGWRWLIPPTHWLNLAMLPAPPSPAAKETL